MRHDAGYTLAAAWCYLVVIAITAPSTVERVRGWWRR